MNWLPILMLMVVCAGFPLSLWLLGDADLYDGPSK